MEEIAAKKGGAGKIARSAVGSNLYYEHKISNYHASTEILSYFSKELVQRLDPKWHTSPFWQWLVNESKKPSIELQHTDEAKIPYQLVRRAKKTKPATPTAPANNPPSTLDIRPKALAPFDNEDPHSDDYDSSGRRRYAGKGGLRLQSASKKRTATDMLFDDDDELASGRRARKAAKTTNYFDIPNFRDEEEEEEEEEEAGPSDSDSNADTSPQAEAEDIEDRHDGLPLAPPKDAVRVVLHAEKLPSASPTGPNGTWVCDRPDCGYVVRAAEEAAGRSQVQQHFRDHEARAQKAALARTEAERRGGRVPIKYAYFPPVLLLVRFPAEMPSVPSPSSPSSSSLQQNQPGGGTEKDAAPAPVVAEARAAAQKTIEEGPVTSRTRPTRGR